MYCTSSSFAIVFTDVIQNWDEKYETMCISRISQKLANVEKYVYLELSQNLQKLKNAMDKIVIATTLLLNSC